LTYFS